MGIIGINIKSVKAEIDEKKTIEENVNVNSSPVIENIEKKEINVSGIKDVAAMSFRFETTYEPRIGEIKIEGEVLYQTDKIKEIISAWKKDKKLDDKIAVDVLNAIFRRCLVETIHISDILRLPPPIRLPIVQAKPKEDEKGE